MININPIPITIKYIVFATIQLLEFDSCKILFNFTSLYFIFVQFCGQGTRIRRLKQMPSVIFFIDTSSTAEATVAARKDHENLSTDHNEASTTLGRSRFRVVSFLIVI